MFGAPQHLPVFISEMKSSIYSFPLIDNAEIINIAITINNCFITLFSLLFFYYQGIIL